MARKLVVEIIGDASSLERAFAKSSRSAKQFGRTVGTTTATTGKAASRLKGLGVAAGFTSAKFLGAAGLTVGLKSAVEASSDLAEQTSKTNQVFGRSAQQIQEWSKTTSDSFGISRRQALATASSFGALFAPIGLVGAKAAEQSQKLTELGADLASFYNTDVQDALDAIRSGVVGESEPLRRYGVLLSETRVQQEALTETGKKHAKQLTAQEKALARVSLIFKDTAKAQGDFARTSGGLANQTRIAQANFDDLKTELGTGLVPVLVKATRAANVLMGALTFKGLEGPAPTSARGQPVETTLVPRLAKLIQQMKASGATSQGIIASLRKRLSGSIKGSPIADQLIEEAFRFQAGDQALIARIRKQMADRTKKAGDAAADEVKKTVRSPDQRNQWFDAVIGRKLFRGGLQPLKQQLVILKQVAALLQQRIAATKDITRKQNLEDQLLQVQADQKDVSAQLLQQQQDAAQKAKDAAQAALEKEQQLAEIQRQRQQAAEERAMGWLEFALEKAEATKGLADDIKATEKIIAFLKKQIRLHGRTLELVRQLWEMEQQLKRLQSERKKTGRSTPGGGGGGGFSGGFSGSGSGMIDPRLLPAGFKLPPPTSRPSGGTGGPSSGFGAGGMNVNQMTVNMYGVQNVKEFEGQLQKRAGQRPQTRRGPV